MLKILLIGNGAREHIIAEKIKQSPQRPSLFTFAKSKNPGIFQLSSGYRIGDLGSPKELQEFAREIKPDFAIVGPEAPLAMGVADMLEKMGIPAVGPKKRLARLETSKSFTRRLLENRYRGQASISINPKFKIFKQPKHIKEFIEELDGEFVVKPDGLTGGKGVKVKGDHFQKIEEGIDYALELLKRDGKVIIEEKLIGQEFSLQSFSDGKHIVHMPLVQDHKRAFVGDKGPNTGGMGSYSCKDHSLPFLGWEDVERAKEINTQIVQALYCQLQEGYKGIIYGGFIATRDGIKLLEYNARFGDPEAMNVLSLLKSDFVSICEGIIEGDLDERRIEFENKATVCKYIVPQGYPQNPTANKRIMFSDVVREHRTSTSHADMRRRKTPNIYFASVDQREDGLYLSSSRALAFVGVGKSLREAEAKAEKNTQRVKGPVFHRKDIGTPKLIEKKVKMMKRLRKQAVSDVARPKCPKQLNLAVFASTRGTDLQAIIDGIKKGELPGVNLRFVLSDKKDCYALERAHKAGIKTVFIDPKGKTREEFDSQCLKILDKHKINLVLLIGYMRLLGKALVSRYRNRIMNIHPSLLPSFPGMDRAVHKEVLDYGCKLSGCTLHFVDEGKDTGPIILQKAVEVKDNDTIDTLKAKVQKAEQGIIIRAIHLFQQGRIKVEGRRVVVL